MGRARSQVSDMYQVMLNSPAQVSPHIQRQIRRYAEDSGDSSLLVLLLGRPDIDASLEKEMSCSSDLEVLSAWASSPRRTAKELSDRMASEKRVNALLPLARKSGLPNEVYRSLSANGSVRLSEALLSNTSTPKDVRVECLRFLVSRPTWGSSRTQYDLKTWLRSPEEARVVAEYAVDLTHLRVAAESSHLPDDAGDVLVRQTSIALDRAYTADRPWWSFSSVAPVLSQLRRFSLSEESRLACLALVERMAEMPSHYWGGRDQSPDRLREVFGGAVNPFVATLRELSDPGCDVRATAERLVALASDNEDRRLAMETLCRTPGVPDELFRANMQHVPSHSLAHLFCTLLSEGRIELLASLSQNMWVSPDVLQALDASPFTDDLVRLAAETARESESRLPAWATEMLRRDRFSALAMDTLPWPELSAVLSRSPGSIHSSGALSTRVQAHLESELGDDQDLWRLFSEVGSSFSGSLPMLTETVKALRS